jgi:hypothetical protein
MLGIPRSTLMAVGATLAALAIINNVDALRPLSNIVKG